jgi:hypothetical protein
MPSSDLSSAIDPAADEQAQATLLQTFLATAHHFFGSFVQLFADVRDPRCPELIRYPLAALLFAGVLLFVCRLGARRQINHLLRGNGASAAKFEALFQVAGCPHGDTLKAAYRRLEPDELQAVVTGMTETLIRRKVLYPFRLLDRYFLVAMDGTGVLVFTERHCPHCLTMTHHDQTLYYHPILEAKLVTATGFVFSVMTEFIENPGEQPTKQDCELKAFYRLAQRLPMSPLPRSGVGRCANSAFRVYPFACCSMAYLRAARPSRAAKTMAGNTSSPYKTAICRRSIRTSRP